MKIGIYIYDLLHYHDCVIVPDLGGFVTRYQSATIHPVQHLFTPPAKSVAFNSELTKNDGLLANYICSRLLLTYPDACKIINDFVLTCKTQLENNQRLVIDNVGEIFYDVERNLQFTPASSQNFLLDSFGLATVQSPAIQRDKPFDIFDKKDASVFPAEQRKNYRKPLIRIIAVAGIAALAAFAYFNPFISSKISKGIAGILPVIEHTTNTQDKEKKVDLPAKEELRLSELNPDKNIYEGVQDSMPTTTEPESAEKAITTSVAELSVNSVEKPIERPANETKPTEGPKPAKEVITNSTPPTVQNISGDKVFYIISGCFSVYENAQKLNSELQSKGYTSAMLGKNKNGLEMVAITYFPTLEEAETGISKIKNEGFPDVWIYRGNSSLLSK